MIPASPENGSIYMQLTKLMVASILCGTNNSNGGTRKPRATGAIMASLSIRPRRRSVGDHFAIEAIDDREEYGEERINLIGMCEGVLLHVTYTERGERIRIISARRAERHEQDYYYRTNAR